MSPNRLIFFVLLGAALSACPAGSDGPDPVLDELCEDGVDNDEDGDVDCDDSDCAAVFVCKNPSMDVGLAPDAGPVVDGGLPADAGGATDAGGGSGSGDPDGGPHDAGPADPENCGDDIDNDGDGLIDCIDEDCYGVGDCDGAVEICDDGIDNDDNGAADCDDEACADTVLCGGGEGARVTCMELIECARECDDDACFAACLVPGDETARNLAQALWDCAQEECNGEMVCAEAQCADQMFACTMDPPHP